MRLLFAAISSFLLLPGMALAGDLSLRIDGIRDNAGSVIGALYASKAAFMDHTKAYRIFKTDAVQGEVKYVVRDLPPGRYAITICHDANNNGKMDKNFIGVPREGFGFSNDPKVTTGPPSFEQTAFDHGSQTQALSITMIYMKF